MSQGETVPNTLLFNLFSLDISGRKSFSGPRFFGTARTRGGGWILPPSILLKIGM